MADNRYIGGKGSRRRLVKRILDVVATTGSVTTISLASAMSILAPSTAVAGADRVAVLSSAGVATLATATQFRTFVLGIAAGVATIPENLTVGGTLDVSGVLTRIGAAALDGSTPVTALVRSTTNGTWTAGAEWGRLGFWSNDGSGLGDALRAYVGAYTPASSGGTTGLKLVASDASSLVTMVDLATASGIAFNAAYPITGGTYNGQTLNATAALTGTLSVAISVTAPTFIGALTGNASTATALQTVRTLWGQNFDGSANVSGAMSGVTSLDMSGPLTVGVAGISADWPTLAGDAARYGGSTRTIRQYGNGDIQTIKYASSGSLASPTATGDISFMGTDSVFAYTGSAFIQMSAIRTAGSGSGGTVSTSNRASRLFISLNHATAQITAFILSVPSAGVSRIQGPSSGIGQLQLASASTGGVLINPDGIDADTVIQGDTFTSLFHADASTDRIGINTATPAYLLDVNGVLNATEYRVGATAGVDFSGPITNLTIVKGIVTAAS